MFALPPPYRCADMNQKLAFNNGAISLRPSTLLVEAYRMLLSQRSKYPMTRISSRVEGQMRSRQGWMQSTGAQRDSINSDSATPGRNPNTHQSFLRVLLCRSPSTIAAMPSSPMLLPKRLCSRGRIKKVRVLRAPSRAEKEGTVGLPRSLTTAR
jgi:hypothetical protein